MTVNLQKGEKFNLSKTAPGATEFHIGLGWKENPAQDLDVTAFILGENGKVLPGSKSSPGGDIPNYVLYYNNLQTPEGFALHSGDSRTGAESETGDDEFITFDLKKAPPSVTKILFVCTIHEAATKGQNFGQVRDAFIRIVNLHTGEELARHDLTEDSSTATAMSFGELYLHNGDWKFTASPEGSANGLEYFFNTYM